VVAASPGKATRFFENWVEAKVRPLLVEHCYDCHSGAKTQGGLSTSESGVEVDSMSRKVEKKALAAAGALCWDATDSQ